MTLKKLIYDDTWKKLNGVEKSLALTWWFSILVCGACLFLSVSITIIVPVILIMFSLQIISLYKIGSREKNDKV